MKIAMIKRDLSHDFMPTTKTKKYYQKSIQLVMRSWVRLHSGKATTEKSRNHSCSRCYRIE